MDYLISGWPWSLIHFLLIIFAIYYFMKAIQYLIIYTTLLCYDRILAFCDKPKICRSWKKRKIILKIQMYLNKLKSER